MRVFLGYHVHIERVDYSTYLNATLLRCYELTA